MYLFDCFLDDFQNEKYMSELTDLEIRAQIEVSIDSVINYLIEL